MGKSTRVTVSIHCDPEQIKKLEAVMESMDMDFTSWQEYAETVARVGFLEYLESRYQGVMNRRERVQ